MVGNTDTHHYWGLSDDIYRFSPTRLTHASVSLFHGANERMTQANFMETIGFFRAVIELSDEGYGMNKKNKFVDFGTLHLIMTNLSTTLSQTSIIRQQGNIQTSNGEMMITHNHNTITRDQGHFKANIINKISIKDRISNKTTNLTIDPHFKTLKKIHHFHKTQTKATNRCLRKTWSIPLLIPYMV